MARESLGYPDHLDRKARLAWMLSLSRCPALRETKEPWDYKACLDFRGLLAARALLEGRERRARWDLGGTSVGLVWTV